MSQTVIRGEIKSVLESVSGIGVVHEYERWVNNWSTFLELFKSDNRIHGWTISRKSTAEHQATVGEREMVHIFVLRGVYGLKDDDGSEIAFQAIVDAVQTEFNNPDNETLNDTCLTIYPDWGPMAGAVGLQVDDVGLRMFGSTLCHYAECRICAVETKDI